MANVRKKFGSYNLSANRTVFDPTMTDIDVYVAEAIPEFDGFDQASNTSVDANDANTHQRENIKPSADKNDSHRGKRAETVGKSRAVSENDLQTSAKRIRLNNGYVDIDKPISNELANRQIVNGLLKKRIENQNVKNIEHSSSSIRPNDKVDGSESDSLDGISSNIAAELMKNFALAEGTLKNLVNQRLEKILGEERTIHKRQMDAMKQELDAGKSQLQKANAEKLELQQMVDRKILQLGKRDRQLAQAHLDYNDLMEELQNAKSLCDACGKNTRNCR